VQENILNEIIDGCRRNDRASQSRLHALFYSYAMTVARAYAGSNLAAEEVVNDAFFKVFSKIDSFSAENGAGFRPWFRRILINTSIDKFRSTVSKPKMGELFDYQSADTDAGLLEKMTFDQIMSMLDKLPPGYRTVFNLFVGEGYTHEEVAETLQISVGASKSNLSRARQHVRRLLENEPAFNHLL
jgi:RNA polymerase sigma factor (sigma-70 family)